MTIKLVKRNQQAQANNKPAPAPSPNQAFVNAQGWVAEFKERKAKNNQMLLGVLRRD